MNTTTHDERHKRGDLVVFRRDCFNESWKQIGDAIQVSATRARQIYLATVRRRKTIPASWADGLSMRAKNIMWNLNIMSREEVRAAINDTELLPGKVRNYGEGTHKEICSWLGVSVPPRFKQPLFCPHCGKDVRNLP